MFWNTRFKVKSGLEPNYYWLTVQGELQKFYSADPFFVRNQQMDLKQACCYFHGMVQCYRQMLHIAVIWS